MNEPFPSDEKSRENNQSEGGCRLLVPAARSGINIDAIRSIALEWLANCKSVLNSYHCQRIGDLLCWTRKISLWIQQVN